MPEYLDGLYASVAGQILEDRRVNTQALESKCQLGWLGREKGGIVCQESSSPEAWRVRGASVSGWDASVSLFRGFTGLKSLRIKTLAL